MPISERERGHHHSRCMSRHVRNSCVSGLLSRHMRAAYRVQTVGKPRLPHVKHMEVAASDCGVCRRKVQRFPPLPHSCAEDASSWHGGGLQPEPNPVSRRARERGCAVLAPCSPRHMEHMQQDHGACDIVWGNAHWRLVSPWCHVLMAMVMATGVESLSIVLPVTICSSPETQCGHTAPTTLAWKWLNHVVVVRRGRRGTGTA